MLNIKQNPNALTVTHTRHPQEIRFSYATLQKLLHYLLLKAEFGNDRLAGNNMKSL